MGEMQKIKCSLCATCKYRFKFGNWGHNGKNACNYLDVAGKSRIFENGEKVVPDGFCDKYEAGAQDRSVSRRWVQLFFLKERNDNNVNQM